ncbi:TMAO reductase system periplasmic protein TorT [Bradyrhizobium manausense]|uniref:TMAO reductase system periplasmic protein TorT n=1 Tax=Bradyrhizobium manausense TaxID=989370 RepID=UPI001BA4AEB2|nr:TMAO reductase system periplasmic protein TorT [Bradyrhizobium manausense]MBR0725516.1 TMAO reductase system periplasmic protein TorT [Bradyrhizobium manausense]
MVDQARGRVVKSGLRIAIAACTGFMLGAFLTPAGAREWYPLPIKGKRVDDKEGRFEYTPLSAIAKAGKNWLICVSFPHMKDPFFLAANYGIVDEAKKLGVSVQTFDAGGYTELGKQISQIEDCVAGGADALIMVAIARDSMDNILTELKRKNIPVVDAINGVSSKDTAVRILTSPYDEGLRAGHYLAAKHPQGGKEVNVAWLPGPAGAGFVIAFDNGFCEGIKDSAVKVIEAKYGDIGREVQARLVEDILQTHKDIDYVVGTAVMVEGAYPLLRARGVEDKVKLVSVYTTPGIYDFLKSGGIEAGASPVVSTARIALDEAVRLLEKKVEYADVGTIGKVYSKPDIGTLDRATVLAPADYRPVFSYKP